MAVAPALLLGIVSETYYAPVETTAWNIPSFAGLGLAQIRMPARTVGDYLSRWGNDSAETGQAVLPAK